MLQTLSISNFEAAVFDMDGVLTNTASVHAKIWKKTFDAFLESFCGSTFKPFDVEADYKLYVDGKLREDGVRDFLQSRNIEISVGNHEDAPGFRSIYSIGNLKNQMFQDYISKNSVDVFQSTFKFISVLRQFNYKIGVITSSRNAQEILSAAGKSDFFDCLVDGIASAKLNLRSKPMPDIFLRAAQELNIETSKAIAVEDALAGVQAAHAANFGIVIGIDRLSQATQLLDRGATFVVQDLADVKILKTAQ